MNSSCQGVPSLGSKMNELRQGKTRNSKKTHSFGDSLADTRRERADQPCPKTL